ncbi:MAG TPA: metal-dependent hydrolase [Bacteroidetes bacterium]|nr:metal-dependent hydrolase [Bacteroidota bacterium]
MSPKVKEKLRITWFGHSAFLLESPGGKRVLVDPWLDNPKAPPEAKEIAKVDLILISHGHGDHIGNTIEVAKRTSATVVAIHEVSLFLQAKGVASIQGMNKGGTVDVGGVKVTMVDAKHSSDIDVGAEPVPGGEAAGFVIEFENGFKAYHAGDTAVFGDMKLIADLYKPHLAFLPIGGLYTMDPRAAAFACRMLKPQQIIGMHYGTFPPLTGTPSELKKWLPAAMKRRVLDLEPGRPIAIS